MKKLLIGSAAAALALGLAAPANAQVKLDLGGHFKGYVSWVDQDEAAGTEVRDLDIVRETEIHFTGETTLDNGLTVGFHTEADIDGGTTVDASGVTGAAAGDTVSFGDSFVTEESYAYFSGAWGRVNFGKEDGAAYLLQVAAPSADSNVDGIRQYVAGFNTGALPGATAADAFVLDYDHADTGYANKLTYLTPVFSGFQAGVSYTPDVGNGGTGGSSQFGNGLDDVADEYGDAYEGALRYEGQFDQVGVALGAGYSRVNLEEDGGTGLDDVDTWNVGLDLNWGAFGIGAAYLDTNNGVDDGEDENTWVVGIDYTTGPFKLGASYLNDDLEDTYDADRWTGGVTYTYGPGMTFRGSISYVDVDVDGADDVDGTNVLLGTQIDF
jgi:hypothetical protein